MVKNRFRHRGVPRVNSRRNNTDGQLMLGNYVLHPTKGWRKVTVVDVDKYVSKIHRLINRG